MRRLAAGLHVRPAALATLAALSMLAACSSPAQETPDVTATPLAGMSARLDAGPVIGAVTQTGARIWVHVADIASAPGASVPMRLVVEDPNATNPRTFEAVATADSNGTAMFRVEGLRPGTSYTYRIETARGDRELATSRLRTHATRAPETRLAFGSCADIDESTARTWTAIEREHPDALVLLGDTPYIDTTALATQRERYLQFAQAPAFASLVAKTPLYSIWDDHDFGANNTDGRLAGKANSRRAFMESRPNPGYGEGAAAIYTSFRQGDVEVFLLDTRWFAGTEPSRQDPAKPTLLGEPQWRWLESGLARSDATFKVIACGMVWSAFVAPGKTDCWGAYPHEFERFVRLVASTKATGVVLVSGDVHRSRVVVHRTASVIGYDLTEFATSPLHGRVIADADVRKPADGAERPADAPPAIAAEVLFDRGEPNAFLMLDAETPAPTQGVLMARFVNARGERFHSVSLPVSALRRAR
jgi:alkaline phosphatase D